MKSKSVQRRLKHQVKTDRFHHCIQCGEPLIYVTDTDKPIHVCSNPECPNYGLLQMGSEKMQRIWGY